MTSRFYTPRPLLTAAAGIAALTVCLDWLQSSFRQSGFYLSESLLFSSFWWLFLPLLLLQVRWQGAWTGYKKMLLAAAMASIHLLLYPLLVGGTAALWLDHGYDYTGTLQYAIVTYSIPLLLLYAMPLLFDPGQKWPPANAGAVEEQPLPRSAPAITYLSQLPVSLPNGTRLLLSVSDVWCFAAQPPYVSVQTRDHHYLVTGTLRKLEAQLDPAVFIRVHKSTIIRLAAVAKSVSRQNGDYDLYLSNGETVRLSRSHAGAFKAAWPATPLAAK